MPTKQTAPHPPGYHLNHALLLADKSGRWLAEQVRVSQPHVSRWRKGMRPSQKMQERIADVLSKELGRKVTPKELGW